MENDIVGIINPYAKLLPETINNNIIDYSSPKAIHNAYNLGIINGIILDNTNTPYAERKFARYNFDFLKDNQEDNQSIYLEDTKYYSQVKDSGKGKRILHYKSALEIDSTNMTGNQSTGDCKQATCLVTMSDFTKKQIKDVKVGDYVFSGLGNVKKVTNIIKKPYKGLMYSLVTQHHIDNTEWTTEDHNMMTYNHINDDNWQWKKISEVKCNEFLLLPSLKCNIVDINIDLTEYADREIVDNNTDVKNKRLVASELNKFRMKHSKANLPKTVALDGRLCWLFGIYAAEGGIDGSRGKSHRITFNLGSHESVLANQIKDYFKEIFDIDCKVYQVPSKPSVIYVRVYSEIIAALFKDYVPGNIYNKSINKKLYNVSRENKLSLLKGWFDGDGHIYSDWSGSCTSVSKELVSNMFDIANMCHLDCATSIRLAYENHKNAYILKLTNGSIYSLYPEDLNDVNTTRKRLRDIGVLSKVTKIQTKEYDGDVYCIEVEDDHSFIANGYGVSNCVSWAIRTAIDNGRCLNITNGVWEEWICRQATCGLYSGRGHNGQGADPIGLSAWAVKIGTLLEKIYETNKGKYDFTNYKNYVKWGMSRGRSGIPSDLLELTKPHAPASYKVITTTDALRDVMANGATIQVGSMLAVESTGNFISRRRGSWNHSMSVIMYDDTREFHNDCVWGIDNSWGAFNRLTNVPEVYKPIPQGSFFITEKDMQYALSDRGTTAFLPGQWFPVKDFSNEIV